VAIIIPANSAAVTAFDVDNSCRFNDDDSAKMAKTPGSNGSDVKFTFSCWVKRGSNLGSQSYMMLQGTGSTFTSAKFDGSDRLDLQANNSGAVAYNLTNRKFRDPSAWYHIVWAVDTTQGTAGNRVKVYVNGTEETSWSSETTPSEDATLAINNTSYPWVLGAETSSNYFDGYMAEVVYIDGTQYAASDFGEFDSDSPTIWKPKDVSGLTFGTNGFYLDFEDSANLGNDANGGTDLTETNLDATDQATDTPTNNFCTLNPLTKWGGWSSSTGAVVLQQGNCHLNEADHASTVGTMATTNMKFYYEVQINAADFSLGVMGSQPEATSGQSYNDPTAYGYYPYSGSIYKFTAGSWTSDSTFSGTGIYHFAVDPTNNKLWVGKDGTWDGDPAAGSGNMITLGTHEYMPYVHSSGTAGDNSADCNFGGCSAFTVSSANQDADGYGNFEYAVPSGFYSLCTKNLAEYG